MFEHTALFSWFKLIRCSYKSSVAIRSHLMNNRTLYDVINAISIIIHPIRLDSIRTDLYKEMVSQIATNQYADW